MKAKLMKCSWGTTPFLHGILFFRIQVQSIVIILEKPMNIII